MIIDDKQQEFVKNKHFDRPISAPMVIQETEELEEAEIFEPKTKQTKTVSTQIYQREASKLNSHGYIIDKTKSLTILSLLVISYLHVMYTNVIC